MKPAAIIDCANMAPAAPVGQLPELNEQFRPGTLTCLIGPDPDLRKAYLDALAGLNEPRDGSVRIAGHSTSNLNATDWRKLRTEASVIRGAAPLLSIHHALMNVMLPMLYHTSFTFYQASRKARATLEFLEFEGDLLRLPAFLPILDQRVVALARALILRPRALYIDGFFQGLVTHDRRHLYRLIDKVKEDYNVCIVLDPGDLSFNWTLTDRIIFLSASKTISGNSWKDITSSDDPTLREFLWDENVLDPETQDA